MPPWLLELLRQQAARPDATRVALPAAPASPVFPGSSMTIGPAPDPALTPLGRRPVPMLPPIAAAPTDPLQRGIREIVSGERGNEAVDMLPVIGDARALTVAAEYEKTSPGLAALVVGSAFVPGDPYMLFKAAKGKISRRPGGVKPPPPAPPPPPTKTAYHGTAYKFDKFRTAKIGSGEGAQAFGHGLYFAENKEVADYYRKAVAQFSAPSEGVIFPDGTILRYGEMTDLHEMLAHEYVAQFGADDISRAHRAALEDLDSNIQGLQNVKLDREAALKKHAENVGNKGAKEEAEYSAEYWNDRVAREEREVAKIQAVVDKIGEWQRLGVRDYSPKRSKGFLYEVDIPSDDFYLDLDLTLEQQSQYVKDILTRAGLYEPGGYGSLRTGTSLRDEITSQYHFPKGKGGRKGAAQYLKRLGIKGFRYKDMISRHNPDKTTHNYVVFGDKDIKIKNRFGKIDPRLAALLGLGTGAALASEDK